MGKEGTLSRGQVSDTWRYDLGIHAWDVVWGKVGLWDPQNHSVGGGVAQSVLPV